MTEFITKIKSYFLENSHIIRKFWINQFAASVLGIMVTWPANIITEKYPAMGILPTLAALLFCGGFFCFLIYDVIYEEANKDYIRITNQKETYDGYKALKLIMFSYAPTILLAVLAVLFFVINFGDGSAIVSILLNTLIHGMYVGLFFVLPSGINPLAFPLGILATVFFGCLAYFLGVRDLTLRGVFGIKVKQNKE